MMTVPGSLNFFRIQLVNHSSRFHFPRGVQGPPSLTTIEQLHSNPRNQ
jgi:hypothetical protein